MKSIKVKDNMGAVETAIADLLNKEVLVGVPMDNAPRNVDEDEARKGETPTNAEIGYWNEFGIPEDNLPARPHLIPGVRRAGGQIANAMKNSAIAAIKGDKEAGDASLEKAGFIAEASVKRMITEGLDPTLSPATVYNRHHQRGAKSMRKGEKKYFELMAEGNGAAEAQSATGIKALLNTGEYRRSITYVVVDAGKGPE